MAKYVANNLNELTKMIKQSALKKTLEVIAEDVKELIKSFIQESFYNQYDPKYYIRTFSLLNSVTTSDVKETANGYEVMVYIDIDSIHYDDDGYVEEIVWLASQGFHGNSEIWRQGEFWNDAMDYMKYTNYLVSAFGEYLKAKGWNASMTGSKVHSK